MSKLAQHTSRRSALIAALYSVGPTGWYKVTLSMDGHYILRLSRDWLDKPSRRIHLRGSVRTTPASFSLAEPSLAVSPMSR